METEQPSAKQTEEKTPQLEAFASRVQGNMHLPQWTPDLLQHYNERPQLIRHALEMGFSTKLVRDEKDARRTLEKFIWTNRGDECHKKFIIWLFRQSAGLVEEVKIFSPFDPEEQAEDITSFCTEACRFVHDLDSSTNCDRIELCHVLNGIGCPLYIGSGCTEGAFRFFLSYEPFNYKQARRIAWKGAIEESQKIEVRI